VLAKLAMQDSISFSSFSLFKEGERKKKKNQLGTWEERVRNTPPLFFKSLSFMNPI
jgi:hypothetical protein